jgi:hypothetical protein
MQRVATSEILDRVPSSPLQLTRTDVFRTTLAVTAPSHWLQHTGLTVSTPDCSPILALVVRHDSITFSSMKHLVAVLVSPVNRNDS